MDARYINKINPLTHLIQECAEVIQAATKCQTFGYENYHPGKLRMCHMRIQKGLSSTSERQTVK